MLSLRARQRGLALEPGVARYITARARREPGALVALLERLDEASMQSGRPLSLPFVRQTMGW